MIKTTRVGNTVVCFLNGTMYQRTFENNIHVKIQNNIHPKSIEINVHVQLKYTSQVTIHHSNITQRITTNNATAVPSLKRLSHSKRIVNLLGAHILLNIDNTATGSVADIKIQNNKHTINGTFNDTIGKI